MLLIPTTSHLKVINEELVAKITENANLRMKLGDIETTFEATVQVKYHHLKTIHSKSWIRWSLESADNLEFSAERLSENAKTINSPIC